MNRDFAFPFPEVRWPDGTGVMDGACGMTKRELIAMHAMAGMLANADAVKIAMVNARGNQTRPEVFAELARDCADALLAALQTEGK